MNKPFYNTKAARLTPWWLTFIHFLLFILLINCKRPTDPDVVEPSTQVGQLTVGESKAVVSQEIGSRGGTVQFSDPASPLNGFKIEVPAGAYAESRTFKVSYASVVKHDFGPDFTTLSPLIIVENGGGFAQLPMSISLLIQLPANHRACVFMFDDKGDFSVLPTRNLLPNQITVDASHFTQSLSTKGGRVGTGIGRKLLVVSSAIEALNSVVYDTGFKPGTDDWPFPNLGSYAYPDGLCSGMSLSALWYFNEMKGKSGNSSLRENKLVSNPYFEKPDNELLKDKNWVLSNAGIKFVSMAQVLQNSIISFWSRSTASFKADIYIYYELALYYKYNKNPKPDYMKIASSAGSHAILIVGKTKQGLKVVDPNKTEISELKFSNFVFEDYKSAPRSDGTQYIYNSFTRLPDIDYSYINARWLEVEKNVIGQDCFPDYSYEIRMENKQLPLTDDIIIPANFSLIVKDKNPDKRSETFVYAVDTNNKITFLVKDITNESFPVSIPDGTVKIGIGHKAANPLSDCAGNVPKDKKAQWSGAKLFTVNMSKTENIYFSCKVNGSPTEMKYQSYGLRDNTYQIINGYQYNSDNQDYTIGAMFLELQIKKSLFKGVGSYNLNGTDGQAFLYTIKYIDLKTRGHSDYIHSSKNGSGTLIVTSLSGDFIEGTFEFTAPEAYFGTGNGQTMAITDGKFRVKIK